MAHLGLEVVATARHWAKARAKLRRLLDSKRAKTETVDAAKKAYTKASDDLEVVVARVETLAKAGSLKKKARRPLDWHKVFGAAGAVAAAAIDNAVNAPVRPAGSTGEIIDAEFEVIDDGK